MSRQVPIESIPGAFCGKWDWKGDDRGALARIWCREAFTALGVDQPPVQANLVTNAKAGTLRGMHYQRAPHGEAKLVARARGDLWDVGVDLRPGSPTMGRWAAVRLDGRDADYVWWPEGIAHGYQSLADDTEVLYLMWARYVPEASSGVNPFGSDLGIPWPLPVVAVAAKDRSWPTFAEIHT